jgi:serine/threonine-protein kinase
VRRGSELRARVHGYWVGLAVGLVLWAGAGRAQGQGTEAVAAATAQFDLGRALMKEKNYPEACAAFERSQKLDPQWGTLYNLATCYAQSDRLASAWAAYRELAQRDTNPARRKDSAQKAKDLEKRLPRLLITAPVAPGLVVTLDGADVTALVGTENPVDLGRHAIHAAAPGYADFDRARTIVDEGKQVRVVVELRVAQRGQAARPDRGADKGAVEPAPRPAGPPTAPAPAPPASPTREAAPPTTSEARPTTGGARDAATSATSATSSTSPGAPGAQRRLYGALAAAGGGALILTGLVFGQLASSKWSDAKAACGGDATCDTPGQLAMGNQLASEARSRANAATALVIVGLAAAGAGAALFFTAPRDAAPATALRLVPVAASGGLAVALGGRF